jgi:quinoprotein glucose dehydrogenase
VRTVLRYFLAAGLASANLPTAVAQPAGQPQTIRDGVYIAEQATRGEQLYSEQCSLCHGDNLLGIEMAPPVAGPNFKGVWGDQSLLSLAGRIKTTMPPYAANTLSSAQTVDIVSFMLRVNGIPAGNVPLSLAMSDNSATSEVEGQAGDWTTYGGNLESHRYSPLDQINADNFSDLQVAWRFNTNNLGPNADRLYSATPLMVNGVVYSTAGTSRSIVALNPGTGQMLWMYQIDEGPRGQFAPRRGAGRGLSYWESPDGSDKRIVFVTPGYQMIALDAATGRPVETFGNNGIVDLKLEDDQDLDLEQSVVGLNATPLIADDVVVVGAAHAAAGNAQRSTPSAVGYVRGFDVRTGKRLWIFHTIPLKGEFGHDTWEDGSAERNGNLGAWAQLSADLELGLVYVPLEMPAADYYGIHRPGDNLFSETLVALDLKTGERKWHYQTIHHGLWDWDLPCAPMLYEMELNGETVKVLAQPTKSAFLFVLNRETGEPIWPIEERRVPQSDVPHEKTSPTQPFPTNPEPFDRQGIGIDDLLDFTPELRAEAVEFVKDYKIGPIYTPPELDRPNGPLGTLMLPADVGGANWPGGSFDPETNRLYIHSHTSVTTLRNVPAEIAKPSGPDNMSGVLKSAGGAEPPVPRVFRRRTGGRRRGTSIQGLPLIKPPYDRITAYDMNSGEMVWQKAHSSTPDNIKNNPALAGLDLLRLGQPGRTFIGVLTTKSLVIAGEGGVHTNDTGETVALLRAYDKETGEDIPAEVNMPGRQTGSPMTYLYNGKQYIVLAVTTTGANGGGELIAYALP